jgi:hypothetical protein
MKSALVRLIAILGLGAPLALADVVYRSEMADGTIVYADLPQPGARHVRKVNPGPVSTGTILVTPQDQVRVRLQEHRPSGPGVAVVPTPARERPPELVQGRQTLRGELPKPAH